MTKPRSHTKSNSSGHVTCDTYFRRNCSLEGKNKDGPEEVEINEITTKSTKMSMTLPFPLIVTMRTMPPETATQNLKQRKWMKINEAQSYT